MVSSLSTSRIMVCNFNYRITSFSTLLSQSNCALDPGVSSWLWHFANSLYPVPNYLLNVSLHSLAQVKIFNWKNGLSLFFFFCLSFSSGFRLMVAIPHVMICINLAWHGIFLRLQRFSDFAKSIIWVVDSARSTWRQTVGKTHDLIGLSILHLYCGLKASYPEVHFGSLAWSPR